MIFLSCRFLRFFHVLDRGARSGRGLRGRVMTLAAVVLLGRMAGQSSGGPSIFDDDGTATGRPPAVAPDRAREHGPGAGKSGSTAANTPASAARGPAGAASSRPARLPVPGPAEQAKAEKALHDRFQVDYARHDSLDRAALAQKLLHESDAGSDDPSARYVMLRDAGDLAAQAGAAEPALEALGKTCDQFAVDPYPAQVDLLHKLAKSAQAPRDRIALAKGCSAALDEAKAQGKYAYLSQIAPIAQSVAATCPSVALAAKLRRQAADGVALRAEFDRAAAAAQKLKQDPSDPASAATEGLFLCLLHGDWPGGLPLLARSTDPKVKAAATCEEAKPSAPPEEIAAGDAWIALAKGKTPPIKAGCEERAAYWYGKAVGDSTGLARAAAVLKLQSIPGQMSFSRIADAVSAGQTVRTQKVGGGGGNEFSEVPADGAILVGFTATDKPFLNTPIIASLRPIWRSAAGRSEGETHGTGGENETTVEAEPGYAVGAISAKGGSRFDGFQVIFMRIKPDASGLDPADSYTSDWVDGQGGKGPFLLSGNGKFIVGLYGFMGKDFDSVGLVHLR